MDKKREKKKEIGCVRKFDDVEFRLPPMRSILCVLFYIIIPLWFEFEVLSLSLAILLGSASNTRR